ncbi:4-phosphopantetheinyl transferase [Streptomyces sp. RB6PN25]|uniref:4-phosphopantetheinyl transferase n=1 Tax=Streptomyces humicola TaxID=2953240 RepID=A0ABT1PTR6_9ACTN|nr:4'-phosphopantetheinyl transferase superfamily protein [Streptomyces humicola]MCQ4081075.1 4-phosphopantetheinyl transferase [Streptomyces humicola]
MAHRAPVTVDDGVWVVTAAIAGQAPSAHPDDQRRASALPERRAREFLAGRGLLRGLLATVCPTLADATIAADALGKPWLTGRPDIGISVSHSGCQVAAAVAPGRALGVDLQHPAASLTPGFARRLLHGHAARLDGLPPARAAEEVAWVWTAQEACAKASGEGIAGRPWEIDIPPGARCGQWRGYRWVSLRGRSATPLSCAFAPATMDDIRRRIR